MKTGRTLTQLAAEIERRRDAKRDFVAHRSQLSLTAGNHLNIVKDGPETFPLTDYAHGQLAATLGIPKPYYDRMRTSDTSLLDRNVNHWLTEEGERRHMIRTLDGMARALVSDRYQRIENEDIAEVALPILAEEGGENMRIASCELTERRMYIKAVFPKLQGEVKRGDAVQAGVLISNSEVGSGAVVIAPMIYRLVCTNGMISGDALRRNHVGRKANESDEVYEMLSDETREADDRALLLKVRDVVRACTDTAKFESTVERLRAAAEDRRMENPVKAVEVLAKRERLSTNETGGILRHLVEGGDLSRYGMLNAVTRFSQDVEDYDRATELEALGGKVLSLPKTDWSVLAEAA